MSKPARLLKWIMQLTKVFWLALITVLMAVAAQAFEVPPSLREVLVKSNHTKALKHFEAITSESNENFIRAFLDSEPLVLGAGFNGIAYKDNAGGATKLSHLIFLDEKYRAGWTSLFLDPRFQNLDFKVWHRLDLDRLQRSNPVTKELLGSLMWYAYDPSHVGLPDLLSADGLAYRREFISGPTLGEILLSERTNGTLHQQYNMDELWAKVIKIQRQNEKMLFRYGVIIDLVNPGNIIVSKKADGSLYVAAIDHEIIRPTNEAIAYYANQGIKIPELEYMKTMEFVRWPVMPNHIVQTKAWDLSFEQSIFYLQKFYKFKSADEAVEYLSKLPKWNVEMFPYLNKPDNIDKAVQLIDCQGQLLPKT